MRLVRFYGIRISDLVADDGAVDQIIVRRDERGEVNSPVEGIELFVLARGANRRMNPLLAVFQPRGESAEHAQHDGEEFLHVLDGVLDLEIEGRGAMRLAAGDSAYFFADRP